ncbi:MAG: RNA polymerase II transcription factor SIII subunit A-domain-containing protein [Benjaminiella poitrasii]|nr:MAG: RNA polymerase II transcription factor SIII subunit A-domain-containing protein [Benjaminiella poitrasii]
MPKLVKTLKIICQDILSKYLDALDDVGCMPYSLLKPSLVHATPQQLYRIERANPDIALESDELWLKHFLQFKDLRDEYEQGSHRDSKQWRKLYLQRHEENEKKREMIKNKIKSQYNKIQSEKEKRSIKVLHGVVSTRGSRTYEAARRSTMSRLFQQTKKETDKLATMYHSSVKRHTPKPLANTFIRAPISNYG